MKVKFTRYSATACAEMTLSGVLLVKLCGPLTGAALLHFKAQIAAHYGATIAGFVADYRDSVVALDGAGLDSVLDGEPSKSAASMPAALVVADHDAALFDGHCVRMAERGVLRRRFSEPVAALAWAMRHAARFRAR